MSQRHNHPSYLELDALSLGAPRSPETQAHVDKCERCRSYLAAQDNVAVPPLEQVLAESPAPPRWDSRRRVIGRPAALGAGLAFAAAAAIAGFILLPGPTSRDDRRQDASPEGLVTAKGMPSAELIVHRAGSTFVWDERSRLVQGDRLRLAVAPAGYTRLAVVGLEGRGEGRPENAALLYSGAISDLEPSARGFLVPKTWESDGAGRNAFAVVFSMRELTEPEAVSHALQRTRTADVYAVVTP